MAAQGWSSLPADMVNHVAGCLLATNDLDYYMDLRAVCHHWRSSTADPRINQHDPRFRPSQWVMLNEHESLGNSFLKKMFSIRSDGSRLFVNATTGRFTRKSLPLLRDYIFVTTTTGVLLVLAARDSPHPVRVLNPFTGSLIRFSAPMPTDRRFAAALVGSSPTLVLASVVSDRVYRADPQSDTFSREWHTNSAACRLPQIALDEPSRCSPFFHLLSKEDCRCRPNSDGDGHNIYNQLLSKKGRCHVAQAAATGVLFAVLERRRHGMEFFNIDASGNVLEHIKSIGNLALFLGDRCLVVDAGRFPTIEANCVYFQVSDQANKGCIFKFNIETSDNDRKPELVSAAMGRDDMVWRTNSPRPFTIIQLLCNYTMDIRFPLEWERRRYLKSCVEFDYYDECNYIDYADEIEPRSIFF